MVLYSAIVLLMLSSVAQSKLASDASQKGACPPTSSSSVAVPNRATPPSPIPDVHYIGAVSMLVFLSDTGYVCDVKVVKGIEEGLDKQAVQLIRQQVFQPIRQDGKPIAGSMLVQRDFWRGNASDTTFSEIAGASSDEISPEAKRFHALAVGSVLDSGKIDGDKYRNQYFGISLTLPGATLTIPAATNDQGTSARLVDAEIGGANRDNRYTISIIADRLANYPELKSLGEYIDGVSSQWTREGSVKGDDFPYTISDVTFVGTILKASDGPQTSHFRAILSTVMKGYLLSLDISAAKKERVLQIASSLEFKQD